LGGQVRSPDAALAQHDGPGAEGGPAWQVLLAAESAQRRAERRAGDALRRLAASEAGARLLQREVAALEGEVARLEAASERSSRQVRAAAQPAGHLKRRLTGLRAGSG